ncbi:unnamed protein product [Mytilus edulis]|uniref:Uncharacterized protein n=1 Tax=Mytilus edulis TaxID=6550 RepID=A0A8S3RHP5_MYTED|nr:unnamed protein product [Mytilus edulis]
MMDFAENFSTRYQDECQSAHWCYDQITIHPSVCYYSDALGETVTHEVSKNPRNLNLDERKRGASSKNLAATKFSKDLETCIYSQHNILKHQEEDQVVLLQDHEYSIPNIMDKALETNEKIAEDFIKEACINSYNSHDGLDLDKQISSVCKLGKSVLFKSSAKRIGS